MKPILSSILLVLVFFILNRYEYVFPQNSQDFMSNDMLKVGTQAPEFQLDNIDGNPVSLSDLRGKIVLLDFWYIGCAPCVKAENDIDKLMLELKRQDVILIGINCINNQAQLRKHLKKNQRNSINLLGNKDLASKFKVRAYPSLYLLDRNGKIIFVSAGYYPALKSALESEIVKSK